MFQPTGDVDARGLACSFPCWVAVTDDVEVKIARLYGVEIIVKG